MTRLATCSPTAILIGATAAADRGQAEDLVRARRLLDPVRIPRGQGGDRGRRLRDPPALVRVDRDADARADRVPGERHAAGVHLQVDADLQLDLAEPVADRLPGEPDELLVGVADPPGGAGVRGVAGTLELRDPLVPARPGGKENIQRLLPGQRVLEVAEVDEVDDLLGGHVGEQSPDRLARHLGGEVPGGVDDGPDRHVHDALFRAEPAELAVTDELGAEAAEVADDVGDRPADDVTAERFDRGDHHLVAAPDGEAERVRRQAVDVGAQHRVGGRVVGVGVHRVRPVVLDRGREAHVEAVERHNPGTGEAGCGRRLGRGNRGVCWLDLRH